MSQEDLNKLLKKFSKFDNDHSGDITFHGTFGRCRRSPCPIRSYPYRPLCVLTNTEFREALGLPNSEYVKRLFRLLDTDDSGTTPGRTDVRAFSRRNSESLRGVLNLTGSISWKKYISGIALLSEEVRDDEAIKLAFKLFDQNDDGRIEQDELFAYARTATHTHTASPAWRVRGRCQRRC